MTTYLLITSGKPTELTTFVGPKDPLKGKPTPGYKKWARISDDHFEKMETAKASRLPVVNAEEIGFFVESGQILVNEGIHGLKLFAKLDTPVELEGWEVEIVYQYHSSKQFYRNAYWVDCIKDQYDSLKSVGIESIRQAYRLKRSEPVKPNNSPEVPRRLPI